MLNPKEIRRRVYAVIEPVVFEEGFRKNKAVYVRDRTPDIQDCIAIGGAVPRPNGPMSFRMNLAIRFNPLHELLDRITDHESPRLTFLLSVDALRPNDEWEEWHFERNRFDIDTALAMRRALEQYAYPFFETLHGIDDVYDGLERFGEFYDMVVFQPTLQYLMGHSEEALVLLRRRLRRLEGVAGENADTLRAQSAALMWLFRKRPRKEEV